MKLLMRTFAFLVFATPAIADPLARHYATEIVQHYVKTPDGELEFSEWRQSVPGGYILRFPFDVNNDGSAEVFLASSFNADKLVCEWTVYDGISGKKIGNSMTLRPDGFWWNPSTREILDYFRFGAEGGAAIFSRLGENGLITRNEPVALDEVETGLGSREAPRQGFQRIKPDVTISLLADVVANADLGWRKLILDEVGHNYGLPNGRLLLTEDAPRVEALRNFTPQVALDRLGEAHASPTRATLQHSAEQTSVPKNLSERKSALRAKNEIPGPSFLMGAITAVTALVIILIWLLLKKRK